MFGENKRSNVDRNQKCCSVWAKFNHRKWRYHSKTFKLVSICMDNILLSIELWKYKIKASNSIEIMLSLEVRDSSFQSNSIGNHWSTCGLFILHFSRIFRKNRIKKIDIIIFTKGLIACDELMWSTACISATCVTIIWRPYINMCPEWSAQQTKYFV